MNGPKIILTVTLIALAGCDDPEAELARMKIDAIHKAQARRAQIPIDKTVARIDSLETALQSYAIEHGGTMPEGRAESMIQKLRGPENALGVPASSYLTEPPKDAWGHRLNYRYPGTHQEYATMPDIWSNGPDGVNDDGGGDDITNWSD